MDRSDKAPPPVLCSLISHTRDEMLLSKVPVQLSKGEVAKTKSSEKLVSVHYEGEKKIIKPYKAKFRLAGWERDGNFMGVY